MESNICNHNSYTITTHIQMQGIRDDYTVFSLKYDKTVPVIVTHQYCICNECGKEYLLTKDTTFGYDEEGAES